MRVLHIIESLGVGGAEQLLVTLLPVLKTSGVECHVAVLWPPHDLAETLQKSGIVIHRFCIRHRWSLWEGTMRLTSLLKRNRYDVIHAHMFFSVLYSALSRFFVSAPRRIVSFHNLGYDSYPANGVWKKIRKAIDTGCNRYLMDGHVAVSFSVRCHYERHLRLSSVNVIPNCVRVAEKCIAYEEARDRLTKSSRIEKDEFLIVMPGRMVHEKGHRFALQGLSLLRAQGLFPTLLIVGDGPLASEVTALVEAKGLGEQVILQRAVPQEELFCIMAGADLILAASTHEGWGLIAAEALAMGKPLLATNVGGVPEVVESGVTGLLVPPADPDSLASGMAQLMSNGQMRLRLGEAGKRSIQEKFTSSVVAPRWVEFYESLFRKNGETSK